MRIEDLYTSYKHLLLSLSYQMLGSLSEAEDIVHDIFLDLQNVDIEKVSNVRAYLCKMVTNRSIDYLKSAKKQREVYTGIWLPEPICTEDENDPLISVLKNDRISYAVLTLMEKLNPIERAVFVLKEAFDFKYDEIARFVGKEEANCRKILSRVKKKLEPDDEFPRVSKEQSEKMNELIYQFMQAFSLGDTEELFRLLSEDAVVYTDGGGKVVSAVNPIFPRKRVVQLLLGLLKRWSSDETRKIYTMNMNGQIGIIVESKIEPPSVVSLEFENNQIKNMFIVRNPDKLKYMGKLDLE